MKLAGILKSFKLSKKILCILLSITLCLMLLPSALFKTSALAGNQPTRDRVKAEELFKFQYDAQNVQANCKVLTQADLLDVLHNSPDDISATSAESVAENELKVQLVKAGLSLDEGVPLVAKDDAKYTAPSVANLSIKEPASNQLNGLLNITKNQETKDFNIAVSDPGTNKSGNLDLEIAYATWTASYDVVFSSATVSVPSGDKFITVDGSTAIVKYKFAATGATQKDKPVYTLTLSAQIKNSTEKTTSFSANIERLASAKSEASAPVMSGNTLSGNEVNETPTITISGDYSIGSQFAITYSDFNNADTLHTITTLCGFKEFTSGTEFINLDDDGGDKVKFSIKKLPEPNDPATFSILQGCTVWTGGSNFSDIDIEFTVVFQNPIKGPTELDVQWTNVLPTEFQSPLPMKLSSEYNESLISALDGQKIANQGGDIEDDVYLHVKNDTVLLDYSNISEGDIIYTVKIVDSIKAGKCYFTNSSSSGGTDITSKYALAEGSESFDVTVSAPDPDTAIYSLYKNDGTTKICDLDPSYGFWCNIGNPKLCTSPVCKYSLNSGTSWTNGSDKAQLSLSVGSNTVDVFRIDNSSKQIYKASYIINFDSDAPVYSGYAVTNAPGSDNGSSHEYGNWIDDVFNYLKDFWFSDENVRIIFDITETDSAIDLNNSYVKIDNDVGDRPLCFDEDSSRYYYDLPVGDSADYDVTKWSLHLVDNAGNITDTPVSNEDFEGDKNIVANAPNPESVSLVWQKDNNGSWVDASSPESWIPTGENITNENVRMRIKVEAEFFKYTVNDSVYGAKPLVSKTSTFDASSYYYHNFYQEDASSNIWWLDVECNCPMDSYADFTISFSNTPIKDILGRDFDTDSVDYGTKSFSVDKLGPELLESECSLSFDDDPSYNTGGYYNKVVTAHIFVKEHYQLDTSSDNLKVEVSHDGSGCDLSTLDISDWNNLPANSINDVWEKTITFAPKVTNSNIDSYQGDWEINIYGTDVSGNKLFTGSIGYKELHDTDDNAWSSNNSCWKSKKLVNGNGDIVQDWTAPSIKVLERDNWNNPSRSKTESPDHRDYFKEDNDNKWYKTCIEEKYSWSSELVNVNPVTNPEKWAEGEYSFSQKSGEGQAWTNDNYEYTSYIKCEDNTRHELIVSGEDLAGNPAKEKKSDQFVLDSKHPVIDIQYDKFCLVNGKYLNLPKESSTTISVTVDEHNFWGNYMSFNYWFTNDDRSVRDSNIDINVDDAAWQHNGDIHTISFTYFDEGDYRFEFEGKDIATNELVKSSIATETEFEFTIDKTDPVLNVVWDNNNVVNDKYYTSGRTAYLSVYERNFLDGFMNVNLIITPGHDGTMGSTFVSGWSHENNDLNHSASVSFPTEGTYAMTIEGKDLANRVLYPFAQSEFVIDWTQPNIQITNVQDHQAYGDAIQPVVTINDANMSPQTNSQVNNLGITKGNPFQVSPATSDAQYVYNYPNPEKIPDNDGVYRINVNAYDMAGNASTQTLVWSVNRFGSTYVIDAETEKIINGYVNDKSKKDVKVTEINPSNIESSRVELTKGTFTSTLEEGKDYTTSTSGGGDSWVERLYTIDKNFFKEDNRYSVNYYSKDAAGNENINILENKNSERNSNVEVKFMLDNAKPVCYLNKLSEDIINEFSHQASIYFEDNSNEFTEARVKIDGQETYVNGDDLKNKNKYSVEFELQDSLTPHMIDVSSIDKAGNTMDSIQKQVVVSTNPFILWFYNTPLFVGTLIGLAALIAGIIALIAFKKKKKEEEDK